jgi:hypothetical protein
VPGYIILFNFKQVFGEHMKKTDLILAAQMPSNDLEVGQYYECGNHSLSILAIETHFGNTQVHYLNHQGHAKHWEHISIFRKMLAEQTMTA